MTKFRDMTDSEKLEIINAKIAGERVDVFMGSNGWGESAMSYICIGDSYRIPKRPMSIDWSVLKDEYICAARDITWRSYAYTKEPKKDEYAWGCNDSDAIWICQLKSYDPGTVGWTESLIWRPGYGDNK